MLIGKIVIFIFIINTILGRTYTRNQYDTIRDYFTRNRKLGLFSHMNDMFKLAKDLTNESNQKGLKYMQKNKKKTDMDVQLADFVEQLKPKTEFIGMTDLSNFAAGLYYDQLIDLYGDLKNWKKDSVFKNLAMTYANKIEAELILCGVPFNDEQYQVPKKEQHQINFVEKKKIGRKNQQGNKHDLIESNLKGKITNLLKQPAKIENNFGSKQSPKIQEVSGEPDVNPKVVQILDDKSEVHEEEFDDNEEYNKEKEEHGEYEPDLLAGSNEERPIKKSSEKKPSREKFITLPTTEAWFQESPTITYKQTKEYDANGNLISETPLARTEGESNHKDTSLPQEQEQNNNDQNPDMEAVKYIKLPDGREAWHHEEPQILFEKTISKNEKGEVINETPVHIKEDTQKNLQPLFDEIHQSYVNTNIPNLGALNVNTLIQPQKIKKIRRIIIIENVECEECTQDPAIRKFIGMSN